MEIPFERALPEVIRGRFWLPDHKEIVLSGELTTSRSHNYDLHVDVPHYALEDPGWWEAQLKKPCDTIFGIRDDGKEITLHGCQFYSSDAIYAGPRTANWQKLKAFAHQVVIGAHVDDLNRAHFVTFSACLTGFNEWVADFSAELFADPIPTALQTKAKNMLRDFGEIEIISAGITQHRYAEVGEIRQVRFWKPVFRPSNPVRFNEVTDTIRNFQRLLSLLQGGPVGLDQIQATVSIKTQSGAARLRDVELMVMMIGYKERFEQIKHYDMLVPYNEISTNWHNILNRWFFTYPQFAAILNLYFAVIFGKALFEEHKFLFLAQAIEGYHRCRFRTERTFRERLSETIEPVNNIVSGFIKDVPKFTKSVKDLRDALTHPGISANVSHVESRLLWRQLKAVFEICFLADLDVPKAALHRIARETEHTSAHLVA